MPSRAGAAPYGRATHQPTAAQANVSPAKILPGWLASKNCLADHRLVRNNRCWLG